MCGNICHNGIIISGLLAALVQPRFGVRCLSFRSDKRPSAWHCLACFRARSIFHFSPQSNIVYIFQKRLLHCVQRSNLEETTWRREVLVCVGDGKTKQLWSLSIESETNNKSYLLLWSLRFDVQHLLSISAPPMSMTLCLTIIYSNTMLIIQRVKC